ncbi:MAG: extracellular solute-binding protein [Chlamydiae bacterium]|nr:extracellular solute-binding protein [Chlamydiota bacterium]
MKKFCLRSIVILGWSGIIFSCLYLPKVSFFQKKSKTINVFAWGDIIDPAEIARFEKKTGIKVQMSYYASNEELIVKMKATKGEGYDLIIPSDYAVKTLIKENLLAEIDKSKLQFLDEINKNLLGQSFDPNNDYSIPLEWEIFGFGIDSEFFKGRHIDQSWGLIFNKDIIDYKISMTNDPIEAALFSSFYLFGNTHHLDEPKISKVKTLLINQKKWVEAYANFRGDYFLATKNCPVVVASSSYIWKTMRKFPFVSFVVPKEGTFICIENLAIPKAAKNNANTYEFINFLFQHDTVKNHFEKFGFFPSTLQSIQEAEIDPRARELIRAVGENFDNFHLMKEIMNQNQVNQIWIEIKSSPL